MSYFLARLQKNIFLLSVGAGAFLGAALAYLIIVLITFQFGGASGNPQAGQGNRNNPGPIITPPPSRPFEDYQEIISGNFFRDSPVVQGEEGIEIAEIKQFTLMGVLAGSPEFANAAIQLEGESEPNEYYLGEEVGGSKIISIFAEGIVIQRGDSKLTIRVGESTGTAIEKQKAQNEPDSDPNATKVSIQRSKILELANNQEILYQNKFAPITKDGKILGLRLIMVPQTNILYEMGARSGDILKRVNGQPLENQEKMFQIWQSVKTQDKFTVDLERGGKNIAYEILIQN
ncbi:MAG TPA: hypothetical protein DEA96_14605 [Leptospiraceae bacterium]|nr:hypothetical protein [Spirochaetaceae bacterium]HBS06196.1 hypothetical protein [Leptospiraceae bacterium]|tara:strand:- start:20482 stop:21348 length:867 start_codon:yes stop_codon:yes gene_type:complete